MALSDETIENIMTKFGSAFMHKDFNALSQVLTEDAKWHFAFGPHAPYGFVYSGLEGFKQGIADHEKRFQSLRFEDISYFPGGADMIVMTAQVQGIYADGKAFDFRSVELITVRDNRISIKDVYWKQKTAAL